MSSIPKLIKHDALLNHTLTLSSNKLNLTKRPWSSFGRQNDPFCIRNRKSLISSLSTKMTEAASVKSSSPITRPSPVKATAQFYRRPLPSTCVSFSSDEGKIIFRESLLAGYANIYFRLAEQFRTQDEPAYCGLSTLVMVLNALEVDPKRIWKGVWRWYHEDMLQCCVPLDAVQQNGITLDQFVCLAVCNCLDAHFTRIDNKKNIDEFRQLVRDTCQNDNQVLTCSYSRSVLGQSGDGHFSPIGAYHPDKDMVLIFDVARFKYPPHWVSLELLWKAMLSVDQTTGLTRGYILLQKTAEMPLLLFRMSTTFRATMATGTLSSSRMADFLHQWQTFLNGPIDSARLCETIDNAIKTTLASLNKTLSALFSYESIFTTQVNLCCLQDLTAEHNNSIKLVLESLENTVVFEVVDRWVKEYEKNNKASTITACGKTGSEPCNENGCCRLQQVGISVGKSDQDSKSAGNPISICDVSRNKVMKLCKHSDADSGFDVLITDSHYVTLFLLCWPYNPQLKGTASECLHGHVKDALRNVHEVLLNEVKLLRMQVSSLLTMVNEPEVALSS